MNKGKTNNPNGRPAGTPNKVTSEVRQYLQSLFDGQREQIEQDLKELEPKERLEVMCKILPYIVPKPRAAEEEENKNVWTEELRRRLGLVDTK